MANSEDFCEPINPCTWFRGALFCPLGNTKEMLARKYKSIVEKEVSSIIDNGGDKIQIVEESVRFLKSLGVSENGTSWLRTALLGPEEEMSMVTVTEKFFLTVMVLAVLTLLTRKMGMPEHLAYGQWWIHGLQISSIWCGLIYSECPIYLTPLVFGSNYLPMVIICMTLQTLSHDILMGLHALFLGSHFLLDFILQGLVLANLHLEYFINQLCERNYEIFEWVFDTIEEILDRSAKLCEHVIERVFGIHIHIPTIKNLSQGQRHLYRCVFIMVCITSRKKQFAATYGVIFVLLFGYHFNNIVGSTQLWHGLLVLWQKIKEQLHMHVWQRWRNMWEQIKERLCNNYFKIPAGLQPNRYHTRFYIGLNRLRVMEYGILIQVRPDFTHVGRRCFRVCGIHVFHGEPVSVPVAPHA